MTLSPTSRLCTLAFALLGVSTVAHAQNYGTNFDGTDYINYRATPTTYASPSTAPTDPLDGQNGWTTNDATQTGTYGTSAQLVGRSDYVGQVGAFFSGQAGALGGIYRTTAGAGAAPDVVPSTATGGLVTLARPFTAMPYNYTFNVDFAVISPGAGFATRDGFSWNFGNGTASSFAINFTPSATAGQDTIGYSIGTGANNPSANAVVLNAQYHLQVNVTVGATPSFTAVITSGTNSFSTGAVSLTGAPVAPTAVTQIAANWNLTNKTATGNAYQGAGDNYLAFDNYAVPEPSTYVMMAFGLMGLIAVMRSRRAQA